MINRYFQIRSASPERWARYMRARKTGRIINISSQAGKSKSESEQDRRAMIEAIPLKKLGTTEEVAVVVGFIASGEASYVTGATIDVNGGRFMMWASVDD